MKKNFTLLLLVVATAVAFSSCTMTKQVAYFQNMEQVDIESTSMMPEIHIKPNDELTILVSSITPEAAAPFNMQLSGQTTTSTNTLSNPLYTYIVDKDGNINFPVIGKVKVVGLSRTAAEDLIRSKIQPYFSAEEKPVVKVRYASFKVTVIGEVSGSRVITVPNERLSIIEALAQAGDLSIYGKRPNVLLVREGPDGKKLSVRYNLNDANIFNSPYYYLEQNDIIYVEPQKARARSADMSSYTFWTPLASIAMSVATLVISLTK